MSVTTTRPLTKPTQINATDTTQPHELHNKIQQVPHEYLKRYLISATASVTSELLTFPLDTIKTYSQLNNNNTVHYKLNLTRLYDGVNAALTRSLVYGGLGMVLYVPIRDLVTSIDFENNTTHNTNDLQTSRKLAAGMISGAMAQGIAQPTDVAKAIIQAHGRHMLIHNITTVTKPTILNVWSDIVKHEGVTGLYRGMLPSVQRAAIINGVWVSSYDSSKHYIRHYLQSKHIHTSVPPTDKYTVQYWLHRASCVNDRVHDVFTYLIASQFAALCSALIAAPTDTIKTRMMTMALSTSSAMPIHTTTNYNTIRYKGSIDCLTQTVRHEGLLALFKGAGSSVIRGSPWNFIYFIMFEEMSQKILGRSQI